MARSTGMTSPNRRRAFGETDAEFHFADGNGDGSVDAADYVVWRKALESGSGLVAYSMTVPEPSGLVMFCVALHHDRGSFPDMKL